MLHLTARLDGLARALRPSPEHGLPAALLLAFLALKAYGLQPAVGDENIYFYMSTRVADGLVPWRDFFFAHPPLHLLPGVVVSL
ncbi:MAG TPA: hypothetical protein VNA25_11825, partial [Phycisphaerae bacterium]|nr:hypothetical protein [Phycisphaerae bacterium]